MTLTLNPPIISSTFDPFSLFSLRDSPSPFLSQELPFLPCHPFPPPLFYSVIISIAVISDPPTGPISIMLSLSLTHSLSHSLSGIPLSLSHYRVSCDSHVLSVPYCMKGIGVYNCY